jgi:hypothetical protein
MEIMTKRKGFSRMILTLLLFLLLLPLSCLWFDRNTPTEPPPGTQGRTVNTETDNGVPGVTIIVLKSAGVVVAEV